MSDDSVAKFQRKEGRLTGKHERQPTGKQER